MSTQGDRLRQARIDAGFERVKNVLERYPSWNANSYKSHDNGNAPFSFSKAQVYAKAFKVDASWLYAGPGQMADDTPRAPVIGLVGSNLDGFIQLIPVDQRNASADLPPGGTPNTVALEVDGNTLPDLADVGGLLYFENTMDAPTSKLVKRIVIAELEDGRMVLGRLGRGEAKDRFDVQVLSGNDLLDQKLKWAARISCTLDAEHSKSAIHRIRKVA